MALLGMEEARVCIKSKWKRLINAIMLVVIDGISMEMGVTEDSPLIKEVEKPRIIDIEDDTEVSDSSTSWAMEEMDSRGFRGDIEEEERSIFSAIKVTTDQDGIGKKEDFYRGMAPGCSSS